MIMRDQGFMIMWLAIIGNTTEESAKCKPFFYKSPQKEHP